jgi:hypothetical protein
MGPARWELLALSTRHPLSPVFSSVSSRIRSGDFHGRTVQTSQDFPSESTHDSKRTPRPAVDRAEARGGVDATSFRPRSGDIGWSTPIRAHKNLSYIGQRNVSRQASCIRNRRGRQAPDTPRSRMRYSRQEPAATSHPFDVLHEDGRYWQIPQPRIRVREPRSTDLPVRHALARDFVT